MLADVDHKSLAKLIGCKIQSLSGQLLYRSNDTIKFKISDVAVNFQHRRLLFSANANHGFFENEEGSVFYSYTSHVEDCISEIAGDQLVKFATTSNLKSIGVYARAYRPKEFIPFPEIYEETAQIKEVCDLFFFSFEDGNKIVVVFHPFMPGIEVIYGSYSLNLFLYEYQSLYTLKIFVH